ncbi:MAG: hypothetical protein K1060chlam4_01705 [Candidatus Anoxychlamydiales bacterium]|nr:hypothetical protein [Candidatus Anoxychlamydiales bacterium]
MEKETKLKTLKDIDLKAEKMSEVLTVYILRQEAIKWVKAYSSGATVVDIDDGSDDKFIISFETAVRILRLFFNITEEDLR